MSLVEAIAAEFEKFDLASHDPKWSSWLLDRLFDEAAAAAGATAADSERGLDLAVAAHGLDLALERNKVELTETVVHLIVRASHAALSRYGWTGDWTWTDEASARPLSAARAFLFVRVLSGGLAAPHTLVAVLRALEGTWQLDEALWWYSDEREDSEARRQADAWLAQEAKQETVEAYQWLMRKKNPEASAAGRET